MIFTLQQKTKILKLTLKGYTDTEIADTFSKRSGVSKSKITYSRTYNQLPKRKTVLGFIILNFIVRLGSRLHAEGSNTVTCNDLKDTMNSLKIRNPINKPWESDAVKRYLQKQGVRCKNGVYSTIELSQIVPRSLDQISEFDESLDPEDFIPDVESLELQPGRISNKVVKPLNSRKKQLKETIEEAFNEGATTVAEITNHLNSIGLKNRAGKSFSRWSVKLLLEDLGLRCHKKIDSREYRELMRDWILTHPANKIITKESFMEKLDKFQEEGVLFTNKPLLYSSLSKLVMRHNIDCREVHRGEEYRDKVEHAVYVKYRHRPITAEEIGEILGLSPMQGNRVMRDYLRIEPFDIWYENLYNVVKQFVDQNPKFRIVELAEHLESSYLSTQRGNSWDYLNTNATYRRLRERYPDLPDSIGRRPARDDKN